MAAYPDSLDSMLAAWNESDPSKIRGHLEKALAAGIRFVDPSIDVTGIDGFEANVHEVQKSIPGAIYSRQGNVDTHHGMYRYHWAIHKEGQLLIQGFDVTEVDADVKVNLVIGFFGDFPYPE